MCRLFAFSFQLETIEKKRAEYLNSFRNLSVDGEVLNKTLPGHEDGWGTAIYTKDETVPSVYKSITSAFGDGDFENVKVFREGMPQTGIAHLRKKTVGDTSLVNTHPFVDGVYSFAHNGTVSEGLYEELASACEGGTDSERLFRKFLTIKENGGLSTYDAYKEMLVETKKLYPLYSAINTILHDGESLYVSRLINTENHNPLYSKDEVEEYYTLFLGKTREGDSFISSEKICRGDIVYKLIPNNTFCVINLKTGQEECSILS